MTRNSTFIRKVVYIGVIALLLIPLSWLSQPATMSPTRSSPGGKLAQLRTQYDLSQAELGDIDPASETMKLATLGMRGVAANILWGKANHYKMTEDWDNLSATLNQITKLQPNFIVVWEFQAHNLSYNVSAEFDDYRHRYHWVKKGIDFLITGTHYNRKDPRLLSNVGWYFGQKFGRADEHRQFRQMFRVDKDFLDTLTPYVDVEEAKGANSYDNWLMARLWYLKAHTLVETQGVPIKGASPLLFYNFPAMNQINYAAEIEKEGILDEVAQRAWREAGAEWYRFGSRQIPTSYGHTVILNNREAALEQAAELTRELEAMVPSNTRAVLHQQKLAKLTQPERDVLEIPADQQNEEQQSLQFSADQKLKITYLELANRVEPPYRAEAKKLAETIENTELMASRIASYRQIVNFDYWRTRCAAEASDDAIKAREFTYKAGQLFDQAILEQYTDAETGETNLGAREMYEAAWDKWNLVFEEYPVLIEDVESQDLMKSVNQYRLLLEKIDATVDPGTRLPADFKLQSLLNYHENRQQRTPPDGPGITRPPTTTDLGA